jgi:hypothetical protein
MSSYVVPKEHIDFLIDAICAFLSADPEKPTEASQEDKNLLGRRLWELNRISVRDRYDEEDDKSVLPEYVYTPNPYSMLSDWSENEVQLAIRGYLYQCSDVNDDDEYNRNAGVILLSHVMSLLEETGRVPPDNPHKYKTWEISADSYPGETF